MLRRLALVLTAATALWLLPAGVAAHGNEPVPLAPVGFQPDLAPPPGAHITVRTITLQPGSCAMLNEAPSSAGGCQAVLYSYGRNFQPLPVGVRYAASGPDVLAAGYWYWSWWDQMCSAYGCWYSSFTLQEDGVANGSNVWQWNKYCTPGGINTNITWCGYNYNGGGYPYYAMQFGLNGTGCPIINGGPFCINHGMRRWIDDWGNPGYYTQW